MNKTRRISLLLCIVFLFSCLGACAQKQPEAYATEEHPEVQETEPTPNANDSAPMEDYSYEIESKFWDEDAISLAYPTIVNCDDQEWVDAINEIIESDLYNVIDGSDGIRMLAENPDDVTIDADYDYTYSMEPILSIKYTGTYSVENAAYPVNFYHTITINLDEAEILTLSDLFVIDQAFVNAFKMGTYAPYGSDVELEAAGENVQDLVSELYTDEELIALFSDTDVDFYMTDTGIILSVVVPHNWGDHLEMAVNYENIESNIIAENPVWANYNFLSESVGQ